GPSLRQTVRRCLGRACRWRSLPGLLHEEKRAVLRKGRCIPHRTPVGAVGDVDDVHRPEGSGRTGTDSAPRQARPVTEPHGIDRYWRAANYLSVGQIYLQDNPLLREPLVPEHIKPRLLGHWGTTPGLNFIYAHLNHQIRSRGTEMMWIVGPGHGGPSPVATAWLDGVYSQIYPDVGRNAEGMRRLFRQFSFPGGVPSHAAPETPGSIHEGGELGYALAHAFGAAFDNPDLVVAAVVGDGEAETG